MAKMGRPTKYSEEIADKICEAISFSNQGLVAICDDNEDFPSAKVVYDWLNKYEDFRNKYARAREVQADFLADEIIEIADETSRDTIKVVKGEAEYEQPNNEWINRSRLRVDARKWKASKLAPKKYGDKLDLTTQGDKIHTVNVTTVDEATKKQTENLKKGANH